MFQSNFEKNNLKTIVNETPSCDLHHPTGGQRLQKQSSTYIGVVHPFRSLQTKDQILTKLPSKFLLKTTGSPSSRGGPSG